MPEPISNTAIMAGGSALMAAVVALGKWLLGREVDRLDKSLEAHARDIDMLKSDHVGQADMDRIVDKVEQIATRVGDKLEAKVDAVHARIDQVIGLPPRK
jgi:hypothetical protein